MCFQYNNKGPDKRVAGVLESEKVTGWHNQRREGREIWRYNSMALKMENGTISQSSQAIQRVGKGKETDSSLEPLEGMQPCWYLHF